MAQTRILICHYIYKLTCLPTGQPYIGRTTDIKRRLNEHRNDSSGKKLRAAIEMYGFDNFSVEILCECTERTDATKMERYYMRHFNTRWPQGLNVTGTGAGALRSVATPDSAARRAAAQRRLWDNPEHRQKVSARVKAFWAKPENAAILSARMTARWQDPEFRAHMKAVHWSKTNGTEVSKKIKALALAREDEAKKTGKLRDYTRLIEGTHVSWSDPERRKKRLQSIQDFWNSPEGLKRKKEMRCVSLRRMADLHKDAEKMAQISTKISMATKGKKRSLEVRRKMSLSAKKRWARHKENGEPK